MVRHLEKPNTLRVAGRTLPLAVSRNSRARRITVSLDGVSGGVRLVLPQRAALSEGLNFAETKADWLLDQIDALPARVAFEPGAVIPVLGQDHIIRHLEEARRGVWRADGEIWVSGFAEHLPRRVMDFLKSEARQTIAPRAQDQALKIDVPIQRISLRDMSSRWGSCSSDGNLSFCWRLILAPEPVLDYVVAHEVAHLRHMNHGPRFWKLVSRLTNNEKEARRWLKKHGDSLLSYG